MTLNGVSEHVFARSRILVPGVEGARADRGLSIDLSVPLVWTVPDVFDAGECRALIARAAGVGFEVAPITTHRGFEMRSETRNNGRVMLDDRMLAADLFRRVAREVPPVMFGDHAVVGANERLRFYRYGPGERFRPHYDGAFTRDAFEQSFLTLLVYLDEGCEGGETDFPELGVSVVPRRGTALLFQHFLLHEGCVVRAGVKHALRSDVMYRARTSPRAI